MVPLSPSRGRGLEFLLCPFYGIFPELLHVQLLHQPFLLRRGAARRVSLVNFWYTLGGFGCLLGLGFISTPVSEAQG